MKEEDYTFLTVEEISTPKDYHLALVNHWWATDKDGRVMLYRKDCPQCNPDRRIAEMISKRMYSGNVIQIPVAYVPPRR